MKGENLAHLYSINILVHLTGLRLPRGRGLGEVKSLYSQSYGFSSTQVWIWELDYKEIWLPKNWCFWTVLLEKTLESPLDCKEVQPVHSKDQSCERPALSLGGQATAWECSPGRSLCLTKSSACGRLWQFVKKLASNSTFRKRRSWHLVPSLHGK